MIYLDSGDDEDLTINLVQHSRIHFAIINI